ncbi:fibronectin type III domain-containing protein [Reichenbachiella agariperforans]|uniref:fibronectin type III domain-containing protein n=1 Tax=Reichenbachiella agariperforans TaxID=156994 RepID=UPI001C0A1C00|nr:hypothetical protein [Reichenbachiella agariperforans]MBU2913036.1 hypothetical protein [Reichenbachiella agariperforans]
MIRIKYHIVLLLVLYGGVLSVSAQDVDTLSLAIQGKVHEGQVYLRWAPKDPLTWRYANQNGYWLEKVKILAGGEFVDDPQTTKLLQYPLKPETLDQWEVFSDDDYVLVGAQAIFGESFDVDPGNTSDITTIINASRELENRFSFALYAADMSPKAAELSGLFYVDEEVSIGDKYLYRVYPNVPMGGYAVDTATVFIGLANERPLPKPMEVTVEFADQVAMISWNARIHEHTYTTYWVERSADGRHFESITKVPIVSTFHKKPSERIFKGDSLTTNGTTYYYRVIGVDAFGFKGPPSDVVDGTGLPAFRVAPTIASHEISDDQQVTLFWRVPAMDLSLLKTFSISRKSGRTGFTAPIAAELSKQTRQFTDSLPNSSNYYTVLAHDAHGRKIGSFPYMVQLEDSIPPAMPMGLKGKISEKGIVSLAWEENTEEDMRGYKVYKSNYANDGFIELLGEMTEQSMLQDSIALNNLTETIYYRVKAFDIRMNPSEFSEILELKKPDLIPPVAPVFTNIKNDSLGILVQWEQSPSEDVEMHLLYRKGIEELDWSLVYTQEKGLTFYLDKQAVHNMRYAYTLIAVDDDGLESVPAKPITMRRKSSQLYPPVSNLVYKKNIDTKEITINWTYDHDEAVGCRVYKRQGEGTQWQLYKVVKENAQANYELVDRYSGDQAIQYRVQVEFVSGEKSQMSQEVRIEL